MSTLSKDLAARVWTAHREIEVSHTLLADIQTALKDHKPGPWDKHDRRRRYTLGCPSGDAGMRLLTVSPELAEAVVRAHIADKERELIEASLAAGIELSSRGEPSP